MYLRKPTSLIALATLLVLLTGCDQAPFGSTKQPADPVTPAASVVPPTPLQKVNSERTNSSPEDFIDADVLVTSSVLVQGHSQPSTGFLIDKEEGLVVTTHSAVKTRDQVEVVFAILTDGKALVRRSAWLAKSKDRTVNGKVLFTDPDHDLAIIRLDSVPDDATELKLTRTPVIQDASVKFLSCRNDDIVWLPTTTTVGNVAKLAVSLAAGKRVQAQMIVLKEVGPLATGVSGGALLNDSDEVVGVVTSNTQASALRCIDQKSVRPLVAAAFRSFALHAYESGKFDVAVSYGDRALAAWAEDALGYNERGAAYSQLGQFDKAIADYSRALELEPKMVLAYRNRGSAYLHIGKYREAVADCTRAIDLMPNYQSAYRVRRDAYAHLGMSRESAADGQLLAELSKQDWKPISRTGTNDTRQPPPIAAPTTVASPVATPGTIQPPPTMTDNIWYGSGGHGFIVVGAQPHLVPGVHAPHPHISHGGGGRRR
jgi:S1-C subfamily serine protease